VGTRRRIELGAEDLFKAADSPASAMTEHGPAEAMDFTENWKEARMDGYICKPEV
jgi:hypothetical protein